jgi:hypothetical protein
MERAQWSPLNRGLVSLDPQRFWRRWLAAQSEGWPQSVVHTSTDHAVPRRSSISMYPTTPTVGRVEKPFNPSDAQQNDKCQRVAKQRCHSRSQWPNSCAESTGLGRLKYPGADGSRLRKLVSLVPVHPVTNRTASAGKDRGVGSDCGARSDWYSYVFLGSISAASQG